MKSKLTLKEAKERFAKTGECDHDPDFEEKIHIPNSDVVEVCCKACNYEKRRYYI